MKFDAKLLGFYLLVISLIGAGLNVVLKIAGIILPFVDVILTILGFTAVVAMTYGKLNKWLDLGVFAVFIGTLIFLTVSSLVSPNLGIAYSIFAGLVPLMLGVIVGGVITAIIGAVTMLQKKKH